MTTADLASGIDAFYCANETED